ncbi:MAG: YceI family protein [Helicobacteraceae bacterium]|jgi:polyisoprenoid-binding protein YceI|nr:YceI family protein [Helicobacteraceae bacterium]
MKFFLTLAAVFALTGGLYAAEIAVTPNNGKVLFTIKGTLAGTVNGSFDKFSGTAIVDDNGDLTALNGTVEVSSVNTANKGRDDHLRQDDFFDAAKFPSITFASTEAKSSSLHGNLTIRDITKPIVLTIEKTAEGFSLKGSLNRVDFAVGDNVKTNMSVDKPLTIAVEIKK